MRPILVITIMTFQNLLDQLQKLTPEQLKQEVVFVKCGASSDYEINGLCEDAYFEDSDRVQLSIDPEGVWLVDNEFSDGIAFGLTNEELEDISEDITEVIPPNMPFFGIFESGETEIKKLVEI